MMDRISNHNQIEIPPRRTGTGTLSVAFEPVAPEDYWSGWGNAE